MTLGSSRLGVGLVASLLACAAFAGEADDATGLKRYALIIGAKGGDQAQSDEVLSGVKVTAGLLARAGFAEKHMRVFCEKGPSAPQHWGDVSRQAVLDHLASLAKVVEDRDELWVFLYGHANVNRRGLSIYTSGPRLLGEELTEALKAVGGHQAVFCLNRQSAALMPLLADPGRVVVTATNDPQQLNPPVFGGCLLAAWGQDPTAPLLKVLQQAGADTRAHYESRGLVCAEVAQACDGAVTRSMPLEEMDAGRLARLRLALPAGRANDWSLAAAQATQPAPPRVILPPAFDPSDYRVEAPTRTKPSPDPKAAASEATVPADERTRQFIRDAAELARQYDGWAALYVQDHRDYLINADFSTILTAGTAVYLIEDAAAEEFGKCVLSDQPPDYEVQVVAARIIYPDGSWRRVLPQPHVRRELKRFTRLIFPGARAGCAIQTTVAYRQPPQTNFAAFYQDLILQRPAPSASTRLRLRMPLGRDFHFKLYRSDVKPQASKTTYSQVLDFDFGAVPAIEPLACDPPQAEWVLRLQVSSLESWDAFAAWAGRLMQGCDVIDEPTKKLAAELTADARTDAEKVKALYEFLCDLRYDATPIGARRFRPRTASEVRVGRFGDCKDKANALVVMARSLGVEGCFALLNRGATTDAEFPGWQFNHAVAFFPKLEGHPNGLWLDATDGATPFGSLPPGDVSRQAFVFEQPKPQFRTVSLPSDAENRLKQVIDLTVHADGSVTGSARFEASGLADYRLRRRFKGQGPAGVRAALQALMDSSALGLAVQDHKLSALGELSRPLVAEVRLTGPSWSLVRSHIVPPLDVWGLVAAPRRDRPLWLNDGQPLTVEQVLTVRGEAGKVVPVDWAQDSDWATTRLARVKLDDGWQQTAVLKLIKPTIGVEDYPAFRRHILNWLAAVLERPSELHVEGTW